MIKEGEYNIIDHESANSNGVLLWDLKFKISVVYAWYFLQSMNTVFMPYI